MIVELPVEEIKLTKAVILLGGEYCSPLMIEFEGHKRVVYFESETVARKYMNSSKMEGYWIEPLLFYRPGIKVKPHVVLQER